MGVVIRELDRTHAADCAAVKAIDTSFQTATVYDVVTTPSKLELVERALAAPRTKRYSMTEAFAEWSSWDTGYVAEVDGRIVGFASVEYEAWHRRLVLWHLYVAPPQRRTGVGRALLTRCEADGRRLGALRVWLETTSVNVPGIAAYARLGYALCGADTTVYDALPYADEAALYLAKRL